MAYFKDQDKCNCITEPGPYGVFIIDENGRKYTADQWDSTRTDARFVKLSNEILNPEGGPDNSISFSKNWYSQSVGTVYVWQAEYKKLQSVYSTWNKLEAETDYNGVSNTMNAIADAESMRGSTSLDAYIPAFMRAYNFTETFKGEEIHGFLPSMGQYMQIVENLTEINAALQKIGAATFPTNSFWHSSTQYDSYDVWILNNTASREYGKRDYGRNVLVLFSI